jgi:hypothetical protein
MLQLRAEKLLPFDSDLGRQDAILFYALRLIALRFAIGGRKLPNQK